MGCINRFKDQTTAKGARYLLAALLLSGMLAGRANAAMPTAVVFNYIETSSVSVSWLLDTPGTEAPLMVISTAANFSVWVASGIGSVGQQTTSYYALGDNTTYYFRVKVSTESDANYSIPIEAVTNINPPASIYFDEISTWSVTASAYAAQFTGLERGFSGVAITTGAAYDGWNSPGNYWTGKFDIATAYNNPAAAAAGGKLYVFGGTPDGVNYSAFTYEYDPAFNTWQPRANMPNGRSLLAAAAVGGRIYALGGYNLGGTRNLNEEYDPAANAWYARAAMPDLRERHAAVALNGKIYVIGGYNGTVKNNLFVYNPATNSWTEKTALSTAKERVAAGVINGRIYIAGGFDGTQINTVEEYDPATNAWSFKTPMPTNRAGAAAGAIGGKLYVVSGYNGANLNVNEAYDPATDSWTTKAPAFTQREGMAYGVVKGKLYLVGGNNGPYLQTNEEYNSGVSMYFKGLGPNRYYTFKAKARSQNGMETGEVAVSTYTLAIATVPAGNPFYASSPYDMTVYWSSGSQAGGYNGVNAGYLVQGSTLPDFSAEVRYGSVGDQTSYIFNNLASKTTYYFRVQAYNSAQVTDYSWTMLGSTRTAAQPLEGAVISTMAWNSQNFNWPRTMARDSQGNLYIAYLKRYYGRFRVFLSRSSDNGDSWADTTAAPIETAGDMPSANSYDQYWPALAVDSKDVLHLVWGGANSVLDATGGVEPKCVYSSAAAPGTSWTPYVKIPAHAEEGFEGPFNIAVDSNDGLHIAWSGQDCAAAGCKSIRYSSSTTGGAWAAYTPVNASGGMMTDDYPALAIDSKDAVHITARHAADLFTDDTTAIVYSSRPAAGGAWGAWTSVYDGGSGRVQGPPSLTMRANGDLFAAWSSADATYANSQIKYSARPQAGGWSAMAYIDPVPQAPQANPAAAADALGNVYVIWSGSDTVNPAVNLKGSIYDGATWDSIDSMTDEETGAQIYPSVRWSGWRNNGGGINVAWNTWDGASSTATLRVIPGGDVPMSPGWSKTTWPVPAGCGYALNVKKDGSGDFAGIQQAVGAVPAELSTNTCVVIRDDQTYSEQVTVQGIKTGRWGESISHRLILMKDPTFTSSGPVVSPPPASVAAFNIINDSVTVQGIDVMPLVAVSYGILASSSNINISSLNVISGGMIGVAGIQISSYGVVEYSSITVQLANGLWLTGSNTEVSFSTIVGSGSGQPPLYLQGADSNTIERSYIACLGSCYGTSLNAGSDHNSISYSTMTGSWGGLHIGNSSSNTVVASYMFSTPLNGLELDAGANFNHISYSTMLSPIGYGAKLIGVNFNEISHSTVTGGTTALFIFNSSSNTISNSYVQGSTATHIEYSGLAVIRGSDLVATNAAGHGLAIDWGSEGVFAATSTFTGGVSGSGIYMAGGNTGKIELASNTITGGKYGLNLDAMGAGGSLVVSSITFQSLSAGATAINFLGGVFITDIVNAAFNTANIAVNVNGNGLSPTSLVMMPGASGPRWGAYYENDPMSYVYWDTIAAQLAGPADGVTGVSPAAALHAGAPVALSTAQYNYQVDYSEWMNSQAGSPLHNLDQMTMQAYANTGAFSGQDAAKYVANDAYLNTSTATFVFYSTGTQLPGNTVFYWRARVKTLETGEYGPWTSTASFTTGKMAAIAPINNLAVTNVSLSSPAAAGVSISFTLAENNISTGTTPNGAAYNTADWVFVKFSTAAGADGTWNHATLTGGEVGAGATLAAAGDNKGVFINHTQSAAYWTAGATVTWNFAADGVNSASARVKVFAVSMIKVPTGSFVYNAGGIGGATYNNYGGGAQMTVSTVNDRPVGAAAGWPNGYSSFYIMRYELTQGQYADFLNSVHSSTASVLFESLFGYGHAMTYFPANPYGWRYGAEDRFVAKNYLSTFDAWSFLSWAALRPMTEMEYEKAARDISPDSRKYPWGAAEPGTSAYSPPNEGGSHTRNFMNFNNVAGGDKVLHSGRYLSGDAYRAIDQTGASPYGVADLAGNVREHVINCSYLSVPDNGNGTAAWPAGWPATNSTQKGSHGGDWFDTATPAQVSSRGSVSWSSTGRTIYSGARGVRNP